MTTKGKGGVSVEQARDLVLKLDGVTPGRKYGLPAFLLDGKFFARFRDRDTVLVLHLGSVDDREVLMQLAPDVFFFTDHYRDYPTVLIRLEAIPPKLLADVLAQAWKDISAKPKRRKRS